MKITLLILLIFLSMVVQAQTTTTLEYQWAAPTSGSPVVYYIVEHSINGGPWNQVGTTSTSTYSLTATYGDSHSIRVRGVDAEDRVGPYSDPSDPHTPLAGAILAPTNLTAVANGAH